MGTRELIFEIINDVDDKGYIRRRESTLLEFKEGFQLSNLPKYLKTIAAFSNAKGGIIIFGVKDSPRVPIGIDKDKFDRIKQERITTFLSEYFSPEISWNIDIVLVDNKWYGYIEISESEYKPVICKKDAKKVLKNGMIYYRYRAQDRLIQFAELRRIQDEIREKERKLWMKHIEKISRIGPRNVAFIDLFDGSIDIGRDEVNLVLDAELLDQIKSKIKFIEEGNFSETQGEPTLKVIGKVIPSDTVFAGNMDPNKDYPFLQKHLAQELSIRPFDAQVLIWKHQLKGNLKYHIEVQSSEKSSTHKYSRHALEYLRLELDNHPDKRKYINRIIKEYSSRKK